MSSGNGEPRRTPGRDDSLCCDLCGRERSADSCAPDYPRRACGESKSHGCQDEGWAPANRGLFTSPACPIWRLLGRPSVRNPPPDRVRRRAALDVRARVVGALPRALRDRRSLVVPSRGHSHDPMAGRPDAAPRRRPQLGRFTSRRSRTRERDGGGDHPRDARTDERHQPPHGSAGGDPAVRHADQVRFSDRGADAVTH